jgi:hypothetical protein
MRHVYKILVAKPEGKRPLKRYTHRWGDKNKMEDRDWWQALVNMVINLWVP